MYYVIKYYTGEKYTGKSHKTREEAQDEVFHILRNYEFGEFMPLLCTEFFTDNKCRKCDKEGSLEAHSCPYAEEIGGCDDEEYCNCCDNCRTECAMDI